MINRRSFFKSIGSAILGTALVLKLPDSLVPKLEELEFRVSDNSEYVFGWTGYDSKLINGRILAEINLEVARPRFSKTIYIEDC